MTGSAGGSRHGLTWGELGMFKKPSSSLTYKQLWRKLQRQNSSGAQFGRKRLVEAVRGQGPAGGEPGSRGKAAASGRPQGSWCRSPVRGGAQGAKARRVVGAGVRRPGQPLVRSAELQMAAVAAAWPCLQAPAETDEDSGC